MKTLVVVEHDNKRLKPNTYNIINAANQLSQTCDVLIAGHDCEAVASEAALIQFVSKVWLVMHHTLEYAFPDVMTDLINEFAQDYDCILMPASTFGKNILPRVAARLDVGQISDVIEILDKTTFKRPIYAGNAIQTVKSLDQKILMTVRATAFDAVDLNEAPALIETRTFSSAGSNTTFLKLEASISDRPELTSAKVVVSGGRALQNEANFKLIEALADKLNAAVGASRAAVDAGYVPNDYQVGQTGKIVAPELYIAIGISGAIQHIAGMKDSKVIVAINKDPDAPIFQIADYGLVADLFDAVPKLIALL